MLDICTQCPLYQYHNGLSGHVPGDGAIAARYALIGEAPGGHEVELGRPFVGDSGKEQDQYLNHAGLTRGLFHVRNVVQCRPPGNRDPKPDEIETCSAYLMDYLSSDRPEVIGAVGRFATQWFLGDQASMEYCHGIPYHIHIAGYDTIVVPIYHPALGLRSTTEMTKIRQDYEALGRTIRREIDPREWPPVITEVKALDFAHFPAEVPPVVSIDTETLPDGSPWCLTYCLDDEVYHSRLIKADDHDSLVRLNTIVQLPYVTTVLHNALFDVGVLAAMGVYPAKVHDTMVMAYLLQDLPQGLKPLAYRLVDMTMRKYLDVIGDAQRDRSIEYLALAATMTWPDPEAVLVWDKGYPKIKQPQNIIKKITRIMKALAKDPLLDVRGKWLAIDADGGRSQVESVLGPMPQASLADVDFGEALQYACADAVATHKIYPILRDRIITMGLWGTFMRDMRMQTMVSDMMSNGILIDKPHLQRLDLDYEKRRLGIEYEIDSLYPGDEKLNPGSTQQVARALYQMGVFPSPTTSTESKTMDLYRDKHPIVNMITDWRALGKLQSTYVKPLQYKADDNGRVHTKFSNTRTETGRLSSSDPNLQNIPTRTEDGKQIRHAFIARPGCVLLAADYSQIEMRCMAHVAEDSTMIRMFMDDADIHSETAARMFKIPLDQVDKNTHRRPAKSVGFGVAYGMSALGLQDQMKAQGVDYTERECQDLIAAWYGVYPGIYQYMDMVKAEARRKGMVRDFFGRCRLIPETLSALPRIFNAGLRQAGNFPIQSMAQQIIKQAMGDLVPIYREITEGGKYHCDPLLQIHDELVFEVSDEIVDVAECVITATMESAVELSIPTPVDCHTGHTWGELK